MSFAWWAIKSYLCQGSLICEHICWSCLSRVHFPLFVVNIGLVQFRFGAYHFDWMQVKWCLASVLRCVNVWALQEIVRFTWCVQVTVMYYWAKITAVICTSTKFDPKDKEREKKTKSNEKSVREIHELQNKFDIIETISTESIKTKLSV